jgi:TolB protein
MKWLVGTLLGLAVGAGLLGGCSLCEDFDCESGGGGGTGEVSFTRGLVFLRGSARDILVADASDYSATQPLTSGGGFRHPSLSPDGDAVAFTDSTGSRLMRVSTRGGSPATVLDADNTFRNLRNPAFTPDGTGIVFVYDSGGASYLGQVSADGTGGAFQLAGGGALSYGSPSFSKGGKLLAVAGSSGNSFTQLELINPANGATTPVLNNLGGEALQVVNRAVLSPDGTRAAFDGRVASGNTRLFVVDLASRTVRQLSIGAGNQSFPSWVGNTQLAFTSDEGGSDQVYLVPVDGSGSASLTVPSATEPMYGPN